jgi:beta-barrel assembly-enhancing protease
VKAPGALKAPGKLAREIALLLAGTAVLAGLAFGVQRLFFSRPAPADNAPRWLDSALKPVILRQIRAENRLVEDPAVARAVDTVLARLSAADGGDGVEVLVIDSPVVNAFAVPGGVVCVYTGLVKALSSADELAAILAHEMSHVRSRDALAGLARRMGMAVLLSAVSGGRGATAAQALLADLVTVRYGRGAEDRADAFAVRLLSDAGVDPASYARALARIRDAGLAEPGLLRYLDSHSPIDERIERAEAAAAAARPGSRPTPIALDWTALVRLLPTVLEPGKE